MDDGEVAVLGCDGIQVYNAMELPIEKEHHHIDWEISAAEKGGYEHFMLKEIMEQPRGAAPRHPAPHPRTASVVFEEPAAGYADAVSHPSIIIACGSS